MKKARWARVLIVEDSPVVAKLLKDGITRDERLAVVGVATTARQAVDMALGLEPDIMTLDLLLPDNDGLFVLRQVLPKRFVPAIVVSSLVGSEDSLPFEALAEGAVDMLAKPVADDSLKDFMLDLNERLATLAGHRGVVTYLPKRSAQAAREIGAVAGTTGEPGIKTQLIDCVLVGASTGGPTALAELLRGLGPTFGVPIVIVQHIPGIFVEGLVRWLGAETGVSLSIANNGMRMRAGHAYLPPAEHDVLIRPDGKLQISKADEGRRRVQPPSADLLFESAASVYGRRCAGVLLTGMGSDGAIGLRKLRDRGARTFAQDEATCTVFGMPGAAGKLGAVEVFANPLTIATELRKLAPDAEGVLQ